MKQQQIKVITEDGSIKEFKRGYLGTYFCVDWDNNEDYIPYNLFFDEHKKFIGVLENKESKEKPDFIEDVFQGYHYDENELDSILFSQIFIKDGVLINLDIKDKEYFHEEGIWRGVYKEGTFIAETLNKENTCSFDCAEDCIEFIKNEYRKYDKSFLDAFEETKDTMLKEHLYEFKEYYYGLCKEGALYFTPDKIYDFSDESQNAICILKRSLLGEEYKYIQIYLRKLVFKYIINSLMLGDK